MKAFAVIQALYLGQYCYYNTVVNRKFQQYFQFYRKFNIFLLALKLTLSEK